MGLDPTGSHTTTHPQASQWLAHHLKAKAGAMEVTTLHDSRFATTLELAVRFGKTLVVQEVRGVRTLPWHSTQQAVLAWPWS